MKRNTNRIVRATRDGFTLIELLIVVAIVGILSTLAIAGASAYQNRAKSAEATNIVGALARSIKVNFNDNGAGKSECLPAAFVLDNPATGDKGLGQNDRLALEAAGVSVVDGIYYKYAFEHGTAVTVDVDDCVTAATTSAVVGTLYATQDFDKNGNFDPGDTIALKLRYMGGQLSMDPFEILDVAWTPAP